MANLYVMVGVPGSGKSTWIKNNIDETFQKRVSRDEIRFSLVKENEPYFSKETMVFNLFIKEIITNLSNDIDVFADATHLNVPSRRKLLRRIPKHLYDEVIAVYFKPDITVCLHQNALRTGRERVPDKDIYKMYYNTTEPTLKEGFDEIMEVN